MEGADRQGLIESKTIPHPSMFSLLEHDPLFPSIPPINHESTQAS